MLLVLSSAVIAVVSYLQSLHFPFVSDDFIYVVENTRLAGLHFAELWRLFTGPYNSMSEFLPLREFSYWLDMTLFGRTPAVFRVHNIILCLLCLPLVHSITASLWRYLRPGDVPSAPLVAATVTALFALHPAHVEAVVWVSGRKDLLSAMFALLALWFATNARREHGLSHRYAAAALIALLAAMLSKATAVAVAPVIALLWIIFWRDLSITERPRSFLLWPLAILILAIGMAMIISASAKSRVPVYFGIETVTRTLAILGGLFRLVVSPESRHFYYPVFEDPYLAVMVALGAGLLVATVFGAVMALRKRSVEGLAITIFTLICLPSLQLVPYAPPSIISDRFIFLAIWPAALLMVAIAWRFKPLPRAMLLLFFALSWLFQTVERPRDWRSFDVLLDADIRDYPGYYMPIFFKINNRQVTELEQYGELYKMAEEIREPDVRSMVAKVIQSDRAISLSTDNPGDAMMYLLDAGLDLKQPPIQAKWNLPKYKVWYALRVTHTYQWHYLAERYSGDELVRYNAGLWMINVQQYQEAAVHLSAAIQSGRLAEAVRGDAYRNLGLALMKIGRFAEAEASLKQAAPDPRVYCMLADIYKQIGRGADGAQAEAMCHRVQEGVMQ
ncbi:MAG: hypothetical protein HY938_06150 [Nitrosomonadales bacterium]|nr:hypothetical protein [Nitrosomonadales bacterium]